jgi:hypothetical protein
MMEGLLPAVKTVQSGQFAVGAFRLDTIEPRPNLVFIMLFLALFAIDGFLSFLRFSGFVFARGRDLNCPLGHVEISWLTGGFDVAQIHEFP